MLESLNNHTHPIENDNTNEIKELIGLDYSINQKIAARNLNADISKLNSEQPSASNMIVDAFINNNGNDSRLFIYGKAGTGKSFLINIIQKFCVSGSHSFITTASTGIATLSINGITFHSAFPI